MSDANLDARDSGTIAEQPAEGARGQKLPGVRSEPPQPPSFARLEPERSASEFGKPKRSVGPAKDSLVDPGSIRAAAASDRWTKAPDELRIQLGRRRRPVRKIQLR